jgi:diguanylate cyclase (GGDEF)-like protein/PAS domain S-box-containing protein
MSDLTSSDGLALTVFAVVLVVVLTKMLLLARSLRVSNLELTHAAAHQAVLTGTAIEFAKATDTQAVAQAAVSAAVGLTADPDAWSAFLVARAVGPLVVAVAGPASYTVGQVPAAELAVDWEAPDGSVLPHAKPAAGPHRRREPALAMRSVLSVAVDGAVRGKLVVSHPVNGAEALVDTLRSVCFQMGLALQNAEATAERLQRSERRFRSLTQNSSDAVTLLGADGVVLYQSASGRAVLGREAEDLVGHTFASLTHPDDAAHSREQFIKVVRSGQGARVQYECRFRHADGTWRQLETVMTNLLSDPEVAAIVSNSRDVTDRRALEQQLSHQAFHDSLTGLANRALFLDRVEHALDRADRHAGPVAVMFIDIDDFKMVNDSLGHHLGDGVLVAVAERLKAATRPGDSVARLGGDEFAVLLDSGVMPRAAEVVAERIAKCLAPPVKIGTENITVQASIGVAIGQQPDNGADGLLRDADLAMYLAKRNGKGRFEMFHPAMHHAAVMRLETAADLRRGIDGAQFEVYYQPIIDVSSSRTIGAEALVRWHHPTRGMVAPAEFIPVAESNGLIVPLGKWVLVEACRQAQSWRAAGLTDDTFYMSVNLSARQLRDGGLLDDVEAALRTSGLPATALVLEVTESVVMEDLGTAIARLHALKDLGLRLAIDDFGTGYSSLSSLRDLPMDVVKIDKSFVDRIAMDPEGTAMVRGVIALSNALGLTTVAEGVEHDDQFVLLRELGCEALQGYLFARPMPNEEFVVALMASVV